MDNIRGKTIAITGAARGMGPPRKHFSRGARGWSSATVTWPSGVRRHRSHQARPGLRLPARRDRPRVVRHFLDKARTDGDGHIDVLINNAGVMPIGPFLEQSEQSIRSSIEVNFYGVLAGCQLALPDMIARRRGHIINIASLSGLIPVPGQVVYVGAKFGVVGLSAALADEVAPHGVDVSVIMPPFTNTELISGTDTGGTSSRWNRKRSPRQIVKTLRQAETHVSVPAPLRFTAQAAQMLGPRGRRWLRKRLGLDASSSISTRQRAAKLRAAGAGRSGRGGVSRSDRTRSRRAD